MFHIPRVNVIESESGFSIEILGRTGMEYLLRAEFLSYIFAELRS